MPSLDYISVLEGDSEAGLTECLLVLGSVESGNGWREYHYPDNNLDFGWISLVLTPLWFVGCHDY